MAYKSRGGISSRMELDAFTTDGAYNWLLVLLSLALLVTVAVFAWAGYISF